MSQKLMKFNKSHLFKCIFVYGCLVATGTAYAEGTEVLEGSSAPVIHLGGVSAYPGFAIVEKSNDNLFRSDLNKQSSRITVLSPSVLLQAKTGANAYSLNYRADIGRYAQSSADNYDDQTLSGIADLSLSSRATVRFTPELKYGHEDRGSTYGPGTAEPNRFHDTGLTGEFTYGSEESRGRIVLNAASHDVKYQNNRVITTNYDKTLNDFGGTFYYRVSPKVSTFAQIADLRIAYKEDVISKLNGNEQRLLLGGTWEATAQTSGTFKIGQLQKKFDSATRQKATGLSWEGSVRWSPRGFTRVEWISSRKPGESTGVGDFIWYTSNALDFSYDMSERTRLHLNAAQLTEDFNGAGRSDSTPSYGLKAEYRVRSWLVAEAEYSNLVKTSSGYTGLSPNYKSNIISIGLRTDLK